MRRKLANDTPKTESEEQVSLTALQGQVTTLEGQVITLSATKKNIEKDIDLLLDKKTLHQKEIEDLQTSTLLAKKRSSSTLSSLTESVGSLGAKQIALNQSLAETKGLIIVLQKKKDSIDAEVSAAVKKKTEIEKEVEDHKAHIIHLEEEEQTINRSIALQRQDIASLSAQVIAKQQELIDYDKKITATKVVIASQEAKISPTQNALDVIEESIIVKKGELSQVEKSVLSAKEKLDAHNKTLEESVKAEADRARLLHMTEERVEMKTKELYARIEKAQQDKLIGDFLI